MRKPAWLDLMPWEDSQPLHRLPVRSTHGAIASGHYLASITGLSILQQGGNAIDAAIASAAVLAVVQPRMGGLGGDAFMLLATPEATEPVAINANGAAPATVRAGKFTRGFSGRGAELSAVPGVVDGWITAHNLYGSMAFEKLLEPAINYADEGFPVGRQLSAAIQGNAARYARYPSTASVFLPNGQAPEPGENLVQKDLARTLRIVADGGADAFYRGEIAKEIVTFLNDIGGLLTVEDFATHRSQILQPLKTTYREHTVYEQPPTSQGFLLLEMLNIIEDFDLRSLGHDTADSIHIMVEAKKLAFADRDRYFGDPSFGDIPLEMLLSKEHGASLRAQIDHSHAAKPTVTERIGKDHIDTTFLCTVDKDGFCVTYIHSLFTSNSIVAGRTGILLNDRLQGFSADPRHPNGFAPGKRPVNTLNTYMAFRDGQPHLLGGSPGGHGQVQTNLQVLCNILDNEMLPQEAIEAPRWLNGNPISGESSLDIALESRVSRKVRRALVERGHRIVKLPPWSSFLGSAKLIQIDPETRVLFAAADPRRQAYVAGW